MQVYNSDSVHDIIFVCMKRDQYNSISFTILILIRSVSKALTILPPALLDPYVVAVWPDLAIFRHLCKIFGNIKFF